MWTNKLVKLDGLSCENLWWTNQFRFAVLSNPRSFGHWWTGLERWQSLSKWPGISNSFKWDPIPHSTLLISGVWLRKLLTVWCWNWPTWLSLFGAWFCASVKDPWLLIETLDSDQNNGHSEQPKVVVIARGLRNFARFLCWEFSLGCLFFFGWFVLFLCGTRTWTDLTWSRPYSKVE